MSVIELIGASKNYGPVPALRAMDLRVGDGEYVAIVGKSGSGKTTLLNLIAGLDSPSSGTVKVAGQDVGRLNENQRAKWRGRSLGIVFQFFQLLPSITVLDNILLAMSLTGLTKKGDRRPRAFELLHMVAIDQLANRYPPTLSGGEQQRAAIARALANDPSILILDEPTGSIDSEATDRLLKVLDDLHRLGRTLVVVTHDPDVATRANRRVVLKDGVVVGNAESIQ